MTHTGKGLYGNNRVKSAADLILLEKKGRKALEYKDWKAPNQLVRSRSSSTDILWTLCGRRSRKTLRQKDCPAFPMAINCPLRAVAAKKISLICGPF